MNTTRHKCFISYHHANDQYYKDKFVKLFDDYLDIFIDKSVSDGDISDDCSMDYIMQQIRENYLSDCSVTLVLIGKESWKRKYIDWEISASIRNTQKNPRSGLIGILLPSHPDFGTGKYHSNIIPPRLSDNLECNFAKIYNWSENPIAIHKWIDEAFDRKDKIQPDNSRKLFGKNKTGEYWTD